MAGKIDTGTTSDIVKKHEAAINAMSDAEKKVAIAEQLESVEVTAKQVEFYRAKEAAVAQQKMAGIAAIEAARNKAKADLDTLITKWNTAADAETWEIP
jgi:hypothetical protein